MGTGSTAIAMTYAACEKFCAMDFCGMTPREIGAWWRVEMVPAFNAVHRNSVEIEATLRPGSRAANNALRINDKLRWKLETLVARRDAEIERASVRSHNRLAA